MEILVILLLILLNGLFAMSEIALISARRSNLEMQARQGSVRRPPGPETGQRPRPVPLDRTDRHHPDRHSHGYLLRRHAGGEIRRRAGPAGHSAAHGDRHGAGHYRHRGHLPHDHIRRTGPQTHRHERRRAGRKNRRAADAAAFGRGVALRVAALQKHGGRRPPAGPATGRRARSPRRKSVRSSRKAPRTARCSAVEQQIVGRVFSLGDRAVESVMTPPQRTRHGSTSAWRPGADPRDGGNRSAAQPLPRRRREVSTNSLGVVCLKDLFLHLGDEPDFDLLQGWSRPVEILPRRVRGLQRPRTAAHGAAGLRHHLRRIRRDARHHHPARHFRSPGRRTARRRARSRTSCGAKTAAAWWTGSAPFYDFLGLVRSWRTPCPAHRLQHRSAG